MIIDLKNYTESQWLHFLTIELFRKGFFIKYVYFRYCINI